MEIYDLKGETVRIMGLPYDSLTEAYHTATMLMAASGEVITVSKKARKEDEYEHIATVYTDGSIEVVREPPRWRVVS